MPKNNSPYSDLYKGYFDAREPYIKNLEEIYQKPLPIPCCGLEELFNDHSLQEQVQFQAIQEELDYLKQVCVAAQDSGTIEHGGQAYAKEQVPVLIQERERKAKQLAVTLETRDLDIFKYFHFVAARRDKLDLLKEKYLHYYKSCQDLALRSGNAIQDCCQKAKKELLDFQSNLEEERKIAILNAYQ